MLFYQMAFRYENTYIEDYQYVYVRIYPFLCCFFKSTLDHLLS